MMFPNWCNVSQIERESRKKYLLLNATVLAARKKHSKSNTGTPVSLSKLMFAISILVLLSAMALYSFDVRTTADSALPLSSPRSPLPAPLVASSSSPTVLISPGSVSLMTLGSTFTIQVKVQDMAQFNGWDIEVYADPAVLNATSLSITGNDFAVNASSGSAFEIVHCVNGKGTGCTSTDGPGISHSAYGNTAILTGNGLLFTITYKVSGHQPYSVIELQNDLISSPSSGNGVPHASISGVYGAPQGGGGGTIPREI